MTAARRRGAALLASTLVLAGGCAAPPSATPYGGELVIMAPSPDFAVELAARRLPPDWVTIGTIGSGSLAAVERGGLPALRVVNGDRPFFAVRRVDSRLSVTPYLSWAWQVTLPPTGPHPVHLVVGFRDADRDAGDSGLGWFGLAPKLPPHDALLALGWGRSALARGSLIPADPTTRAASRYVVRGGAEKRSRWHAETVDLSDLYHRMWPERTQASVRIVFVGVAAGGDAPPAPMHLAAITLSR